MATMFSEGVCNICYSNICFIEILDFVEIIFEIFKGFAVSFFPDLFLKLTLELC